MEEILPTSIEVLIDYTDPTSVKARTLKALDYGIRVVIGTSGLTAADYAEIGAKAQERKLGYTIAFETNFGLPDERLTICHDTGSGAEPCINGTLLAVRQVMQLTGLVRGLDRLLFAS